MYFQNNIFVVKIKSPLTIKLAARNSHFDF